MTSAKTLLRFCPPLSITSTLLAICLLLNSCSKNEIPSQTKSHPIPQRIITLSPSATEIIYAINAQDKLVAHSDFCDYPEQIKSIPSVGGFDGKTLSIEKILSFNPDFVYLTKGMHDYLVPFLEKHNINYYISVANSISSVIQEIKDIGTITNHAIQAAEVCSQIENKLNTIAQKTKNLPKPTVYWEVWNPPFMTAGNNSFINEIITYAGGINIFNDIEQPYPIISEESILIRNPQVIIIPDSTTDGINSIKNRTNWQNISAVKNNKIYSVDTNIISRPGPRLTQAIELISNCIYN